MHKAKTSAMLKIANGQAELALSLRDSCKNKNKTVALVNTTEAAARDKSERLRSSKRNQAKKKRDGERCKLSFSMPSTKPPAKDTYRPNENDKHMRRRRQGTHARASLAAAIALRASLPYTTSGGCPLPFLLLLPECATGEVDGIQRPAY